MIKANKHVAYDNIKKILKYPNVYFLVLYQILFDYI